MPIKLCNEPRCANVARPGKAKCDEHIRQYERERSAQRRATQGGRPYDLRAYRRRRLKVIGRLCECEGCAQCHLTADEPSCCRVAEQADHITPLGQGGHVLGPMRGLCQPCHAERHR